METEAKVEKRVVRVVGRNNEKFEEWPASGAK